MEPGICGALVKSAQQGDHALDRPTTPIRRPSCNSRWLPSKDAVARRPLATSPGCPGACFN